MGLYFKPLGNYSIAPSKFKTVQKYDFALEVINNVPEEEI